MLRLAGLALCASALVATTVEAKPSRKEFLQQEVVALTQLCVGAGFDAGKVASGLAKRGYEIKDWYGANMIGINAPGTKGPAGIIIYMPRSNPCGSVQVAPVRIPLVTGTMAATLSQMGYEQVGKGDQRLSRWKRGASNVRIDSHFSVNIGAGTGQSGIAIRPDTE